MHVSPIAILYVQILLLLTGVWVVKWVMFLLERGWYMASTPVAEHELGELMGLPLSLWELSGALSHQAVNATHNRRFLLGCYSWLPGTGEMALGQVGNRSYPESH